MKYYKVVRRICDYGGDESKDRLYSVVSEQKEFRCEYKQGEKTVPNIGLLFVFTSYQDAVDWRDKMRNDYLEIWRVAVETPIPCPQDIPNLTWVTVGDAWANDEFSCHADLSWEAPDGTILAESVILLAKADIEG